MPSTINGIGTMYYGKSNLQSFDGVCQHCRRVVKLQNYETRLWFTFIFIPVIPLGRKQVLNCCPACTRHRAIPFGDWERIREQAVDSSTGKLAENPDDPEAAMELHSTLAGFQRRADADRLAKIMLDKFASVSKVQFYLGGWFERTGQGELADACFANAFALEPDSVAARRAVAIGHIEQGRLTEARKLLALFDPPSPHFDVGVFFLLAKGWQRQGEHQQVLDLFHLLLQATPSLARDADFRKVVRQSERVLGVEASCVPSTPYHRSRAFVWSTAAMLIVVGVVGSNIYIRNHRALYVLNGLPTSLTVEIDGGVPVEISPAGRTTVKIAEGPHTARVTAPPDRHPPVDFVVEAGWFQRFFKSPAFVVDPARSAVLLWQSAEYQAHPNAGAGGAVLRWHIGQPFTTYPDVDYLFQEFPGELRVKRGGGSITKTRLDVAAIPPGQLATAGLAGLVQAPGDLLLPFIESHLLARPDDELLLAIYYSLALKPPADQDHCREFLAARLADRPVRVEWHRAYQGLAELQGRDAELIRQYDQWLQAEAGNSALLYLRGRIERRDPALAQDYFNRARAADPASPYPWSAEGHRRQLKGNLAGARQAYAEACRLAPDDADLASRLIDVRFGCDEFAALAAESREALATQPRDLAAHLRLLESLVAQGQRDEAASAQQEFARQLAQPPGDEHQYGQRSRLNLLYMTADFARLLDESKSLKEPLLGALHKFEASLELGQLDGLSTQNLVPLMRPQYLELLLSLAHNRRGDPAAAAAARERALTLLSSGNRDERDAAALLRLGADLRAGATETLMLEPQALQIVLVSLADVCPAQRAPLLERADKLNYRLDFPHQFLGRTISGMRQQP